MRDRTFAALCGLILVNQIGFGLITPVLPDYARGFGLGSGAVGLVIAVYGLARFVANVPAGQVAERYGRRWTIIIGCLITSLASALIATAANLPQLLLYRLLAGLGAATVVTGGQIMVGDIATAANRGRMMSLYQGFFLLGVGLGPTPGGVLADRFGLRAPFVAYAAFSAAACAVALIFIRETRPDHAFPAAARAEQRGSIEVEAGVSVRSIGFSAPFILIGAVSFVQTWSRTGAVFTVVPLLAKDSLGFSKSQIGVGMTVINVLNVAMLYHAGMLADRFGRKWIIVPATFVSAVGTAMFALGGSFWLFLLSCSVWGAGSGLAGPPPAAYVADIAPARLRGRVFGLYRSVADCGYVVGPLLCGWLADVAGYGAPLLLTAAMCAVSGVLFARFAAELRHPSEQTIIMAATPESASKDRA